MKCATCGSEDFTYYQTITEAAKVVTIDENGAYVSDSKYEVTDCIDSSIRCENGHELRVTEDGWNGDVR